MTIGVNYDGGENFNNPEMGVCFEQRCLVFQKKVGCMKVATTFQSLFRRELAAADSGDAGQQNGLSEGTLPEWAEYTIKEEITV
jgi:hypothetical protein